MPNTGPSDGSRRATATFLPMFASASASPMVVVVLPSPAGVGVIAVTRMRFDLPDPTVGSQRISGDTFALYLPYLSRYFSGIPALSAIASIGCILCALAISISLLISTLVLL